MAEPKDDPSKEAPKEPSAPRKRRADDVAGQEIPAVPPAKVKTSIELSYDAHERLHIHAWRLGKSHSQLLEELVNTHLRRFSVQDRGGKGEAA